MLGCGSAVRQAIPGEIRLKKKALRQITLPTGLVCSARHGQIQSGYIAAGSSDGKMLLAHIGNDGYKIWDTTIIASFYLDITSLIDEGSGNFLASGISKS